MEKGRTEEYWPEARRDSTDKAQRGTYKNDQGPIFKRALDEAAHEFGRDVLLHFSYSLN